MIKDSKKKAQSLIEYALILGLVAIVAVTILSKLSKSINDVGEKANTAIEKGAGNAMSDYCKQIGQGSYDPGTGKCSG